MTSFSLSPMESYYLFSLIIAFPVARIFMRFGMKPWWAGALAIPYVGLVLASSALLLAPKPPKK